MSAPIAAEKPRRNQLPHEGIRREGVAPRLPPDQGMREVDGHLERRDQRRMRFIHAGPVLHPDGAPENQPVATPAVDHPTRLLQRGEERGGTAVHDRGLGTVHGDDQIVDAGIEAL